MPLRALPSSPDWVGDDAYPPEAHRREMEGQVMFETWIGTDGVPKACRVVRPSPHVLLDDGTCDRAMRMRFEPARNAAGERIEAAYRARLTWLMSDPTLFGPALLRAELDLSNGQASNCRLTRTGAVPREWMRFACITLVGERAHFLGDHLATARRATILVEMQPDGAVPMTEAAGAGRLVARRRTSFQVDRGGEIEGCRTTIDQGFGPRMLEYSGECGLFLTQAWLERGPREDAPGSGAIEIRVFVER
ncbi:MAG TPA: energy transducer TonB [Allosphingosinicella sp.]|nr:energy transducer TonB [Allosphingosinicella sp.]